MRRCAPRRGARPRLGVVGLAPNQARPASVAALIVVFALVAAGVIWVQPSAPAAPTGAGPRSILLATDPITPIKVRSVTPANGASGVSGATTVKVTFTVPLAASTPVPSLKPQVAGRWRLTSPITLTFTPNDDFVPLADETLVIPGGPKGMLSAAGARLTKGVVDHFEVTDGSTVRLQQLLSILDYSPLSWTPAGTPIAPTDTAAQTAALYDPPAGTFGWLHGGWPSNLNALWQRGSYNAMTKGLVMAFEADHGLSVDGLASYQLWSALLHAVATKEVNTGGYNFAVASETLPETLTIWHNGREVLHNLANTGISAAPTALGTFNVYERLRNQIMTGYNPDGSYYADPVQYVAYFNGGDAVHYFDRYQYGFPQSLGCVELPLKPASVAWPYLSYGTIVQVVR